MRLVLDTNVLIAAFISHGTCAELFEYTVLHHTLITSDFILQEFRKTMREKFGFSGSKLDETENHLREGMEVITPDVFDTTISRDPDDDRVLGTALAGGCDCLITGDNDLLILHPFRGLPIIRPGDFWQFEEHSPE